MDSLIDFEQSPEFADFARAVFESLPYFIAIDGSNRIVYINKQYADALGMLRTDIIGQQVSDILPWSELPLVVENREAKSNCIRVYYPDRGYRRGRHHYVYQL